MHVLLIQPYRKEDVAYAQRELFSAVTLPHLALPALAAATPAGVELTLLVEQFEDIDFDARPDLVGLYTMTHLAPRAYEVADEFRRRGVKTVIGGIHASAQPEEALQHCDCVVVGEAETLWPQLLGDLGRGELRRVYKADGYVDMAAVPPARLDLLDAGRYLTTSMIQTTRGCPFNCSFCSVTAFFGRTFRCRPVPSVIAELERMDRGKFLFITDDNIVGNPRYAKELFRAMAPLKMRWSSQASLNMARDPELLRLAREAGCEYLFVGVESTSAENLAAIGKAGTNDAARMREAIRVFHDHGFILHAGLVFGLDHDDRSTFERTFEYILENELEFVLLQVVTPYPGTRIREQLVAEGRIFDYDWSHYDGAHLVFEPRLMSRDEMMEGFQWIRRQVERRTDLRQNPRVAQFRRLVMEFMTAGRLHTYVSKRV